MMLFKRDRSAMIFTETKIPGVLVIELERRHDERGSSPDGGVRMNSRAPGSTRDYQKAPHAEVKLVRCTRAGVYGDWAYIWTDRTFISGENALQKVLARTGS
jgi:dTDP-4-dehydrorhamnose 3,5-epimerase-like enzyme